MKFIGNNLTARRRGIPHVMDIFSSEKRSAIMRAIKGKNTAPELIVRRLVHGLGYRFRLHAKNLPGQPDLVFPGRKRIIFVHGCFWHQHEGCARSKIPETNRDFWERKLLDNVHRDVRIQNALRALGWHVLVIWACELRNRLDLSVKLINFLGQPPGVQINTV